MTQLQKYDAVNKCETFEEIAQVIQSFADKDGMIQGRNKKFKAQKMAQACCNYAYYVLFGASKVLTREFGIRQRALYIYLTKE